MAGKRNRYGINDAADCYRTFNGEHYLAWMSFPSVDLIRIYRSNGIKCRRIGVELFVRSIDQTKAREIDKSR